MTELEIAEEIIRQEGECRGIYCGDCIQNKDGMYPCVYADSLTPSCDSEEYNKAKADFCKEYRLKENEMEFKVGEPNLKVGDYVSSKLFKGVKQIVRDVNDMHDWYVLKGSSKKYYLGELELVCGFKKGEEVKVSDFSENCDCSSSYEAIFISYEDRLTCKYLVEFEGIKGDSYLHSFKYAKPITEKKYKPYSEPKLDWVRNGKEVYYKNKGVKLIIDSITSLVTRRVPTGELVVVLTQIGTETYIYLTMQELLDECTWDDGSICGEKL